MAAGESLLMIRSSPYPVAKGAQTTRERGSLSEVDPFPFSETFFPHSISRSLVILFIFFPSRFLDDRPSVRL